MNIMSDSARWIADGSAANIDFGFLPDWAILMVNTEGDNANIILWTRRMVDDGDTYGQLITGATGVVTRITTAATGIDVYEPGVIIGVNVPSPVPGADDVFATVADWTSTVSDNATARSGTAVGTIIRPTTHNGRVYECTTAGSSSGTEPTTYTTVVGETVTDGSTVFTCREEIVAQHSALGVTVGATIQTDSGQDHIIVGRSASARNRGDAVQNSTFI